MKRFVIFLFVLFCPSILFAETRDPFPVPVRAEEDAIIVGIEEFAVLPEFAEKPAQMRTAIPEPGSDNLLVSDMTGVIYRVDESGTASVYLDLTDPKWATAIDGSWREQGIEGFAFHPEYSQKGKPGYGRFYTWIDAHKEQAAADFVSPSTDSSHHTVLSEWTAKNVQAAQYDGEMPRELLRIEQPYRNHNGGAIAFNPLAKPGEADFGMLYIGSGDGGSAGDPLGSAQNLGRILGKILRIDPMGSNSSNGNYGIPSDNPFINQAGALPEIYAYGLRNPQQFAWDSATGAMITTDIGQTAVEKISLVAAGDNLGWSVWEGSFPFAGNVEGVDETQVRTDPDIRYPIAEYDHVDPLLIPSTAATGLVVVRNGGIAELEGQILFGELAVGELFAVAAADQQKHNGQSALRRVLFDDGSGENKTLLQLVQQTYINRGEEAPFRMDMRLGTGADGSIYVINKYDGIVRRLTP